MKSGEDLAKLILSMDDASFLAHMQLHNAKKALLELYDELAAKNAELAELKKRLGEPRSE